MRGKGPASLGEIMGSQFSEGKKDLELEDLEKLLGERMPKLEFNPVGRIRLMTALKNRFGKNYRTLPGIDRIMKEFDDHAAHHVKMAEMRMIRPKKGMM